MTRHRSRPPHGWKRAIGPLVMAAALTALPLLFDDFWIFDSFWVGVFAQGIALAVIYLSYTLVTGEGALISLCQITLAGHRRVRAPRASPPRPAGRCGWRSSSVR